MKYALDYEPLTLSNGLRVALRHQNVPDVVVKTRINEGSMHDPEHLRGVWHLIEHMMYRAPNGRNLKNHLYEITGRDIDSAVTYAESMTHGARMTAEDFPAYIKVWGKVLQNTKHDQTDFATERNVVLEEIRSCEVKGTFPQIMRQMIEDHLYAGHPLGKFPGGSTELVSKLTLEDIAQQKQERLHAGNTIITIVGGYEQSTIKQQLEEAFGNLNPGKQKQILFENIPEAIPYQYEGGGFGIPHPNYGLGFRAPGLADPDRVHFRILKEYFGGGLSTELSQRLREESGAVYASDMKIFTPFINPNIGMITIERFNPARAGMLKQLIRDEMRKAAGGEIKEGRLESVKKAITKRFYENKLEGIGNQAYAIDSTAAKGTIYTTAEEYEIIVNTTPGHITAVARKVFNDKYAEFLLTPST